MPSLNDSLPTRIYLFILMLLLLRLMPLILILAVSLTLSLVPCLFVNLMTMECFLVSQQRNIYCRKYFTCTFRMETKTRKTKFSWRDQFLEISDGVDPLRKMMMMIIIMIMMTSNQQTRIRYFGALCQPFYVLSGVSGGSVFNPLLFIAVTNELRQAA